MIWIGWIEAASMDPARKAKWLILWALLLWPCAGALHIANSFASMSLAVWA
jgi:hypothetical protein